MKILIVYYSYSNTTRDLAKSIELITNGDIMELIPEKSYSFTYNGSAKEVGNEIERGYCPKLLNNLDLVKNYDCIFIGTPNWFKTFAPPILSFFRNANLSGKTIIPFCTHGGGGFNEIETNMQKECPTSKFLQGFESTIDVDDRQIQAWIDKLNIL